jgi:hypothetical protein
LIVSTAAAAVMTAVMVSGGDGPHMTAGDVVVMDLFFLALAFTYGYAIYFVESWEDVVVPALERHHVIAPLVTVREEPTGARTSIQPRWRRVAVTGAVIAQLPLLGLADVSSIGVQGIGVIVWIMAGPVALWFGWCYGLRSRIHADAAGIRVLNPSQTFHIPWPDLVGVAVAAVEQRDQGGDITLQYRLRIHRRSWVPVEPTYPRANEAEGVHLSAAHRALQTAARASSSRSTHEPP